MSTTADFLVVDDPVPAERLTDEQHALQAEWAADVRGCQCPWHSGDVMQMLSGEPTDTETTE